MVRKPTDAAVGQSAPRVERSVDALLSVQRPLVLANVRNIRRRHPAATPAEVIAILERHYLAAVTSGGAAVGADRPSEDFVVTRFQHSF